jgi:3,4-dihydroxy-9,10-secoandrosta-1,3,5(10)-triene-9,17-dione 4,5-dioxygenase
MGKSRVSELAYVLIDDSDLDRWSTLATDVLGMEALRTEDTLKLKMDWRPWRFAVRRAAGEPGVKRVGWLASSRESFDEIREELIVQEAEFSDLNEQTLFNRGADVGVAIQSEDAWVHEVVFGDDFENERRSDGQLPFVTDDMGLGHILFEVSSTEASDRLFLDVLRMSLREDMVTAIGVKGHFYGCNPRHHSSAAVANRTEGETTRVMHIMVELNSIDDVGCAFDKAARLNFTARTSLGRHRTDHMLSFYLATPSGFDIEVGWDGLRVDDDTWASVKEGSRAPLWGHAGMQELGRSK